jgi:hypothetical protein
VVIIREEDSVKIRQFLASTALTSLIATGLLGIQASSAVAAEPTKKPTFGFSSLKAATPEAAKAKAEAWLKAAGNFNEAAFNKIWAEENRSVLDRTADSLALANTEAAAILANIRKSDATAPAETPSLLLDAKLDTYFRTNIALAFAKSAASKKVYEEALEALNATTPEAAVDPAALYFFKAVAEFSTMKKEAAAGSVLRLIDDVVDAPDRYKRVAIEMFFEMQNWSADPKDLSNIEKLMDNSGRRLELARGGDKTQTIQKKIVFRLDELIKELENKGKCDGQCNGGNCPNGSKPGNNPGNTIQPNAPANDSVIMGGRGDGNVDEKKLRQIASEWGSLPPEKRAKIIEDITREAPAKYKPLIDEYFKSLNQIHKYNK